MSKTLANLPAAPSPRDLEIYKRTVVLGHHQCAIAMDYNLKQPRISRIIARVRRWLAAGGAPSDPAIRDQHAQQQLAKSTQKLRLQSVIERATYAMEARLPSQVTTRSRYQGMTEVWREETRQQSPEINMPAMRLLLRAVEALDRLDAPSTDDPPSQQTRPLSEDDLLQSVFDLLCRWRTRAESAGHVPLSSDIPQCIAQGLSALIGAPVVGTLRVLSLENERLISQPDACSLARNIPANIPPPPEPSLAPTSNQPSPSAA